MHIAQVNLDKRDVHGEQSVTDCYAGMRERGRINQDIVHVVFSLMNSVD